VTVAGDFRGPVIDAAGTRYFEPDGVAFCALGWLPQPSQPPAVRTSFSFRFLALCEATACLARIFIRLLCRRDMVRSPCLYRQDTPLRWLWLPHSRKAFTGFPNRPAPALHSFRRLRSFHASTMNACCRSGCGLFVYEAGFCGCAVVGGGGSSVGGSDGPLSSRRRHPNGPHLSSSGCAQLANHVA